MNIKVVRRDPAHDARIVAEIETIVRGGDVPRAVAMARPSTLRCSPTAANGKEASKWKK